MLQGNLHSYLKDCLSTFLFGFDRSQLEGTILSGSDPDI